MPTPSLQVLLDTQQARIKNSRISLTVAGEEWDGPIFSETWLIAKTNTLVCNPAPLRADWHTSNAGPNARWGLSDFGLDASDGWVAQATQEGVGAVRMFNPKGMGPTARLSYSLEANRAVFASYFAFNVGNDDGAVYFECGWSPTGEGSQGASLRFWSGGHVDVYKDGGYLARYHLGESKGAQTANRYTDLLLIPARTREITVYSITSGDSFTHVFADIDENEADPVVTLAAPFWWLVPTPSGAANPSAVDVSAAPVFWHDGYATSLSCSLGRPPRAGATLERWQNDGALQGVTNGRLFASAFPQGSANPVTLGLVDPDGHTAFAPNGAKQDCLLRVDLVGGTHTPFVDAAHVAYEAEVKRTVSPAEGPVDVMRFVRSATLEVPDSGEPAEITLTLGWPAEVDALVRKFLTVSNRPAQVLIGGGLLMDGVTMPVKFADGEQDEARTATLAIRDRMHSLREAILRERMPLDGLSLTDPVDGGNGYGSAVEFLYRTVGFTQDELDLDPEDYRLPRVPSADSTKFCHLTEIGAHPFDELQQLQQDLAPDFLWGVRPTAGGARALFKDPDGFSGTPDKTLYRSDEDALAQGADPDLDVYWEYRCEPLSIEANEVRATGYDPRLRRAIQAFKEDAASKDPETPPEARPDNWLGEERVMGIVNKRLTTQEACNKVVAAVFPKVTALYFVAEWKSEMLFNGDGSPIWRGHLVDLDGRDRFRVSSLRVGFVRETDDVEGDGAVVFREATYTGGTLTNAGGVGLDRIRAAHARRAVSKTVMRPGAEEIASLTPMVALAVG